MEHAAVIIRHIKISRQPKLPLIGKTGNLVRLLFGPGQRRQEHGRQDRNNRDDDQELNQREASFASHTLFYASHVMLDAVSDSRLPREHLMIAEQTCFELAVLKCLQGSPSV